jgi:hypothetical protein
MLCEGSPRPNVPTALEGIGYLEVPPTCVAIINDLLIQGNGIMNLGNIKLVDPVVLLLYLTLN